jgi:hypothetical protein
MSCDRYLRLIFVQGVILGLRESTLYSTQDFGQTSQLSQIFVQELIRSKTLLFRASASRMETSVTPCTLPTLTALAFGVPRLMGTPTVVG